MTIITLVKTLPASVMYTGSGVTTISLKSFDNMIINSKKSLIKIQKPKTKNNQNSNNTDQSDNQVIDLKKLEQTIKFTGWLEDDSTDSSWNKFWKLVAMQTRGGALTLLTIGTAVPQNFPSSSPASYPTTSAQAFVESVTGNIATDDTGDITSNFSTLSAPGDLAKPARIKVDLDIYLGYER